MVDTGIGGLSFWTVLLDDRSNRGLDNVLVRMQLLPELISPYEKQLRVLVGGVEYPYDDGGDPSLTTSWKHVSPDKPSQGLLCSGVKLVFDSISGVVQCNQIVFRDGDGNWYQDMANDGTVYFLSGTGDTATVDNLFDGDGTTQYSGPGSSASIDIQFAVPRAISAVGWTSENDVDNNSIQNMTISLNRGGHGMLEGSPSSVDDRDFVQAAEVLSLTTGDYVDPAGLDPVHPEPHIVLVEIDETITKPNDICENPTIVVTPAITVAETRFTVFRETRQDRPHNPPRKGARVDPENLYWFFTQRLFIMQDLCDYPVLGPYLDFVPYTEQKIDFTQGSQISLFLNHGSDSTFSFAAMEMLDGIPGTTNYDNQLIIEEGDKSDGTTTEWTQKTLSGGDYTINSATKAATRDAGATTLDVRIRRSTKIDGLWFDLRNKTPAWNSMVIVLLSQQIRFLVEESCYAPVFFKDSILDNTIFPREWNWLVYTGTDLFHIFGGPFWTGDGSIVVWDNDIKLTDPTNYTTEYPGIKFTGPIIQPHIGSTGNYWSGIRSGIPGTAFSGDGSVAAPEPPIDGSPIDPLDPIFNAGVAIGISITMIDAATVIAGPVAGFPSGLSMAGDGTNTSAFENQMFLAIDLTIQSTFTGETTLNRRVVGYVGGVCNGAVIFGMKSVGRAEDNNGDGTFEATFENTGALGCSESAAHMGPVTTMWNNWIAFRGAYSDREIVTANERAMLQIMRAEIHNDISALKGESIILGLDALVAVGIAAGGNGSTSPSDVGDVLGP